MKKLKKLSAIAIMLTILFSPLPLHAGAEQTYQLKFAESSPDEISEIEADADFSAYGTGDWGVDTETLDNAKVISSLSDYYEPTDTNLNGKKTIKTNPNAPENDKYVNEHTGKEYNVNANYPITLNASNFNATLKGKNHKQCSCVLHRL